MIALLAWAALAASPPEPWTLAGAWTDDQRTAVGDAAAVLPPMVLAEPLHLALTDGASPAVHAARGRLTVPVALLGDPAGLRAALATGALAVLDHRHRWSSDPDWRSLHAWSPDLDVVDGAVVGVATVRSPARALAAMGAVLAADQPDRPADRHAKCLSPARWAFVTSRLDHRPAAEVTCPTLTEIGLDPDAIDQVELIYIAATPASPSSVAGHVLIGVLHAPDATGVARHDVFGLVANTTGFRDDGLGYVINGLTGGFRSYVQWEPYEAMLLRYAEVEDRDVHRFALRLDDVEERRLLERLDEVRLAWRRPYSFFLRNCTELPAELVRHTWGDRVRLSSPGSPEVLVGTLERAGLLERQPTERLTEHAISARAAAADRLRRQAAIGLSADPALERPLRRALSGASRRRAQGYRALAQVGPRTTDPAALAEFLAWSDAVERVPARALSAEVRAADAALRASTPERLPTGRDALLHALATSRRGRSTHTSLRQVAVLPTASLRDGEVSLGVALDRGLYGSELGDARRFAVGSGLAVRLLRTELELTVAPRVALRTRWLAAAIARLTSRPVGLGWSMRLLDLGVRYDKRAAADARWLDGRLLLSPLHARDYSHYVALSAGGAAGIEAPPFDDGVAPAPVVLSAPVGVEARLGSRRQALTALIVRGEWRPTWSTRGPWTAADLDATGSVRLGSIGTYDVALRARARGRFARADEAWRRLEATAALGVVVEPW